MDNSKLRVVFVTSQVTYIPQNYQLLYEQLLESCHENIVGFITLKNLDLSLLKSVIGLSILGASNLQSSLIKNIISLPLKKRERLFKKYNILTKSFNSMNDRNAIEWIQNQNVDMIINLRTRCIYKKEILDSTKLGCVNLHHGVLPEYRGTMCDLYALSEDRPAGFSIHQMNEKIDDGLIFRTKEVSNGKDIHFKDYIKYLKYGIKYEGIELSSFIKEVDALNHFPEGKLNKSSKIILTKNPKKAQVDHFLQKGMIL